MREYRLLLACASTCVTVYASLPASCCSALYSKSSASCDLGIGVKHYSHANVKLYRLLAESQTLAPRHQAITLCHRSTINHTPSKLKQKGTRVDERQRLCRQLRSTAEQRQRVVHSEHRVTHQWLVGPGIGQRIGTRIHSVCVCVCMCVRVCVCDLLCGAAHMCLVQARFNGRIDKLSQINRLCDAAAQ